MFWEVRVVIGDNAEMNPWGGLDPNPPWLDAADSDRPCRQNRRRGEDGDVGLGGFGLTRTTFAPVQALRRASKHASPGFQETSSRTALRLRARLSISEQLTAVPTASGLSNRKGDAPVRGSSSSERSDVHSARGRKCKGSSDTVL